MLLIPVSFSVFPEVNVTEKRQILTNMKIFVLLSTVTATLQQILKLDHERTVNQRTVKLFKTLMRQSAATLCDSVIINNTYTCGPRCDQSVILLRTIDVKKVNGQGIITWHPQLGLVVSFKGSKSGYDYYMDAKVSKSVPLIFPVTTNIKIHSGFLQVYTEIRPILLRYLSELNHTRVHFTGHSLGGVLGILAAIDYYFHFNLVPTVVTFGQPRIGNSDFSSWLDNLNLNITRVAAFGDIVPFLPPELLGYKHSSKPVLFKEGISYYCDGECDNSPAIDFKIHEQGYYGWNTTIHDC